MTFPVSNEKARTGIGKVTNSFGMLHSLLFISVHCYDQLSQAVYQHWSQRQLSYIKVTSVTKFFVMQIILHNHFDGAHLSFYL